MNIYSNMTNAIIHDYSRYKYAHYQNYFVSPKNAFSDYIQFIEHIECEHWYYKVRARNALKAHTEAVYKGIG